MTAGKWSAKDPQDVRDYWIDFTPLGLATDETLTAATVTVPDDQADPASPFELLSVGTPAIALDDRWVVARFSGGAPAKYAIQYHVTTSTGQKFDLTKTLEVKERTA